MARTVCKSKDETPDDERRTEDEIKQRMAALLARLSPPPSLDELARAQGVKPITTIEELPKWPEDDLDAWDGFDDFLEELRHGTGDLSRWVREAKSDDR